MSRANGIKAVNGVAVRRQTVRVREKCETYGTSDSMVAQFIVRQSVRRERVDFKGWGAGLVTVAVGIVVGVGGAICCCCWPVAEARGRQGANDVVDAYR